MDVRRAVGLNVLRLRRDQALSQEELSFRSGFSRAYLSGLEAGRRNPTLLTLWGLANALETTIAALVEEVPTKRSTKKGERATREEQGGSA